MTKKTNHYINNADFLKALIEYKELCDTASAAGKEDPRIQLIKVIGNGAQYWEGDGRMVSIIKMTKAAITGATAKLGETEGVKL